MVTSRCSLASSNRSGHNHIVAYLLVTTTALKPIKKHPLQHSWDDCVAKNAFRSACVDVQYIKYGFKKSAHVCGNEGLEVNFSACHICILMVLCALWMQMMKEILNQTKWQLTELHAKSSFFKRCLVSLSGGSLIRWNLRNTLVTRFMIHWTHVCNHKQYLLFDKERFHGSTHFSNKSVSILGILLPRLDN